MLMQNCPVRLRGVLIYLKGFGWMLSRKQSGRRGGGGLTFSTEIQANLTIAVANKVSTMVATKQKPAR